MYCLHYVNLHDLQLLYIGQLTQLSVHVCALLSCSVVICQMIILMCYLNE